MKRQTKIISFILCLAILTGCLLGITVSAAETTTYTASIDDGNKNVYYGEKMYIAIIVTTEVENVRVATFAAAEGGEPIHISDETGTQNGKTYHITYGISAKEINTTFYYAVVDEAGKEISARVAYGAKLYANERLSDAGITEKQAKLYNAILAYGDAADAIFGTNQGTN